MARFSVNPVPKKAEDAIEDYVEYFERIVKSNEWDDAVAAKYFPGLLEIGSTVLRDLDAATLASFTAIKSELVPEKESFREVNVQKLRNLHIQQKEKVRAYSERCKKLVQECYPKFARNNKKQLARDFFVHGLNGKMKSVVLNQKSEKFNDAVQAALLCENVRETLEEDTGTSGKKQPSHESKYGGSKKEKPNKREVNLEDIMCYACRKKGHFANNCPSKEQKPQVNAIGVRPMLEAFINGRRTCLLIDTGAAVSMLPEKMFKPTLESNIK